MTPLVQCIFCKHLKLWAVCAAFKEGIPIDILKGRFDHTKPFPKQDNNIVFKKKKEKK